MPVVNWEMENIPNKFVELAKDNYGQNAECARLFLLVMYDKTQEEMYKPEGTDQFASSN